MKQGSYKTIFYYITSVLKKKDNKLIPFKLVFMEFFKFFKEHKSHISINVSIPVSLTTTKKYHIIQIVQRKKVLDILVF